MLPTRADNHRPQAHTVVLSEADFISDARLWHPWLRINRVLRVMLQTRWSAEAWSQVRVEFRKALALAQEGDRAAQPHYNCRPPATEKTTGASRIPKSRSSRRESGSTLSAAPRCRRRSSDSLRGVDRSHRTHARCRAFPKLARLGLWATGRPRACVGLAGERGHRPFRR
jgi:hypothetical protein